ncbi:MAG: C-GCAxxG-C-C family protein [Atopobiaceae bacterium]|jgi:C_GCAxxG_C_C family probable redox protein|nr:C-GCAxxG-C-C family protein [Atopobiaceae bacterium]MCI2173089.1 C-GCAxxG-C-C family protein [Atopobiaceae bacterium]MCI2208182.1 C-GCAxxG-C-C family protein [Atopobiaceae bacterium]
MESRVDLAAERHARGYNCAQAVACTYADLAGVDEATVFRATEGLGLGCGCTKGTCGAVTGACVVVGLMNSDADLAHPTSKKASYALSRKVVEAFEAANGATQCRELKGIGTGHVLRACDDCVRDAARIVEDVLFSEDEA